MNIACDLGRFVGFLVLLAIALSCPVMAATLQPGDIVIGANIGASADNPDWGLLAIDPVTGNRTIISDNSKGNGPALTPANGVTIAADGSLLVTGPENANGVGPGRLYRVDPATGNRTILSSGAVNSGPSSSYVEARQIGSTLLLSGGPITSVAPATGDRTLVSGTGQGSGPVLTSNAFVASGTNLFVTDTTNGVLEIDPASGNRTVISSAAIGSGPTLSRPIDIELNRAGALCVENLLAGGESTLLRVDPVTGNRTIVSGDGVGAGLALGTLPVQFGFATNCSIYASVFNFPVVQAPVLTIDPVTGNRTILFDATHGTGPLFLPSSALAVVPAPEPSSLALLGIGAIGGAVAAYRRRFANARAVDSAARTRNSCGAFFRKCCHARRNSESLYNPTRRLCMPFVRKRQSKVHSFFIILLTTAFSALDASAQGQVTIQNLHNFDVLTEGDGPQPLTVVGGKIYGTTGLDGPGMRGAIYSVNPDGSGFQILANVSDTGGSSASGALVSDGSKLYGATVGQAGAYSGSPTIFSVNLDGTDLQPIHNYAGLNGSSPVTLVGSQIYGTTSTGGTNDRGTVFSMNPDGTNYQTLYSFDSSNAGGSQLTLIGSKLYGIGQTGTNFNNIAGTIYSIGLDGTGIQTLHTLPGTTAAENLTVVGSTIYGTTPTPNNPALAGPDGSIFSMNLEGGNFQTLHSFAAGGFEPSQGVNLFDGKLFGSATSISTVDDQVFSINLDGSSFQQVLHFKGVDPSLNIGFQVNGPLVSIGNTLFGPNNFSTGNAPGGGGNLFAITVPEPATVTMAVLAAVGLTICSRVARRRM